MNCDLWFGIVLTFIITASFDLALNVLPPPLGATRIREYFNNHTKLAAALIAGFVGAFTFIVIFTLYGGVPTLSFYNSAVTFSISALIGIPMRHSNIFPHLDKHYYQVMPRIQSYMADGLSGVMVSIVYYIVNHL